MHATVLADEYVPVRLSTRVTRPLIQLIASLNKAGSHEDRDHRNGHDPDEARLFEALCASRFSLFRAIGRRKPAGVRLVDLMRGSEVWLLDEGIEQSAKSGALFAMRVASIEGFVVTCGAVIPVDGEAAEVLTRFLADVGDDDILPMLADDPRFADFVYGLAIEFGLMDGVIYL